MATPLHTQNPKGSENEPSWIARMIAAIIHDIQYLWGYFKNGYTGSFVDGNGNIIEVTDGGILSEVAPNFGITVNETFVSFLLVCDADPLTVEWGDRTYDVYSGETQYTLTHTYSQAGTYTIRINGTNINTFQYDAITTNSQGSLLSCDVFPQSMLYVTLIGNANLTFVNTSQLVNIGEFVVYGSPLLTTLNMPAPQYSFTYHVIDCTGITSIDTSTFGNCNYFEFVNAPLVTSIDLTQLAAADVVDITGCSGLSSINTSALAAATTFICSNCTNITSIATTGLNICSVFTALGCTKLKTISVSGLANCVQFSCGDGSHLSLGNINNILTAFDGYGQSTGTMYLAGQNPPRIPTGAGATAAANLIGKSWAVTTD
jgi:hypothetical protein